ncbi:MAG: hypothetical protein Q4P07_14055 [Ornithinimicrobium sp.]|uniref:hypothetical protein n=1 Tax=Ornithinimicrobium sp. TaxID=1977084 RepID=UPI0026DEF31D|nr:hypothetical protein [Ornithinimicrobium sp.]MDO5741261.1 hypothetical protein [Ornithinimicrobium sp.]
MADAPAGAREGRMEQVESEERVRLARELHDRLAPVSAIAVHGQGAPSLRPARRRRTKRWR